MGIGTRKFRVGCDSHAPQEARHKSARSCRGFRLRPSCCCRWARRSREIVPRNATAVSVRAADRSLRRAAGEGSHRYFTSRAPCRSPEPVLRDLMAWKFFLSLAAAAFVAVLFRLFSRRGDRARSTEESATRRRVRGNDGTERGASSTDASTEGQEVAASSGYDYEVFLSFRGPDTPAGFTDFLYTSLIDAGIRTFRDDEELRVGEKFAPELLQAIEQSKISIPIFLKGYASSPWCLNELVQMVKCQKNERQKIMPIFYDVAPSEVQHQIGGYAKAFRSHEKKQRYDEETIHKWKAALSVVGAINGWDLHNETNR
ncbi:uncharacterized protein LOC120287343 [Eucalyptus grandis]|uniref:uncharacterized protein LOC120287343 n=1 Tax=Eucalyptus grandis TaxID=71139 RepID=UPI00192E989A|nr:uncharacterized protein LOC120287343 [Eucalyptus grandis]